MVNDARMIVGLGEVLWDLLPQAKQLGGAPANFAYMSRLLGHRAIVASRVGRDTLGDELRKRLAELELDTSYLEIDENHPTGTVAVHLDEQGQPSYEITPDVAWDFLERTPEWRRLAAEADVICFGSLAQRSTKARETIRAFLRASRAEAIRIFDVNLRQKFFSAEILAESLRLGNVAKLNDAELPVVMGQLGLDHRDEKSSAERLRREFGLELVSITRGRKGSLLVRDGESDEHPGFAVGVVDLVGAGDAFTAALAHHLLSGSSLRVVNAAANLMGAWVASQPGATPAADPAVLKAVRSGG
jgi:fructokinase